jgi:hypothetical protein
MPYLTRGRDVPGERLEHIADHYLRFGGRSQIKDQNWLQRTPPCITAAQPARAP